MPCCIPFVHSSLLLLCAAPLLPQGIDLFDMGYVGGVTAGGYALAFPLEPPPPAAGGSGDADGQQQQQEQHREAHSESAPAGAEAAATAAAGVVDGGDGEGPSGSVDAGRDDTKLNLWALAHRTDTRPLVPGCPCLACARHTRAYVHHLLLTHEMTAQVRACPPACPTPAPSLCDKARLSAADPSAPCRV